ncbi:hypothetical protein CLIB1423_06S06612 [[Candida] railenensis]|uniref:Uncharacterized protein n=1 Tax=[Candida] railenensis TaxID=45579 RepID=A0A9P0VY15_9ASCO|nr:hypothetical protein CLIB1423_06S06612 [[Candida] railenensis]
MSMELEMDDDSLLIDQSDIFISHELPSLLEDDCGLLYNENYCLFEREGTSESVEEEFSLHSRSSSSSTFSNYHLQSGGKEDIVDTEFGPFYLEQPKLPPLSSVLHRSMKYEIHESGTTDDLIEEGNSLADMLPSYSESQAKFMEISGSWTLDSYENTFFDNEKSSLVDGELAIRSNEWSDIPRKCKKHINYSSEYSSERVDKRRNPIQSESEVEEEGEGEGDTRNTLSVEVFKTNKNIMVTIRYMPLTYLCHKKKKNKLPKRYKVTSMVKDSLVNIPELRSINAMKCDPAYQLLDHENAKNNLLSLIEKRKSKRLYYSRVNINELAILLDLQDYKIDLTAEIEANVLRIFKDWCGYALGYCSWVRDTKEKERTAYIDKLYQYTRFCYPELNRPQLEIIIKRGTYNVMQGRLRKDRRRS